MDTKQLVALKRKISSSFLRVGQEAMQLARNSHLHNGEMKMDEPFMDNMDDNKQKMEQLVQLVKEAQKQFMVYYNDVS